LSISTGISEKTLLKWLDVDEEVVRDYGYERYLKNKLENLELELTKAARELAELLGKSITSVKVRLSELKKQNRVYNIDGLWFVREEHDEELDFE